MFRRLSGRIGGFTLVFSICLVGLAVSVGPQSVLAQVAQRQSTPAAKQSPDVVPAEFIGDWVPAKVDLRFTGALPSRREPIYVDQRQGQPALR